MPDPARRGLLRLLTCGSVDDGKSTLIGRLLHDTGQIMDDTLEGLARDSQRQGGVAAPLDLALLTDGLEAEREQGITIDVAHRYFATARRGFILADTPGHEQYTRNMATAASNSELAVILVDARKGVLAQTRRHGAIAAMLGIRHAVLAVNKMDLVDWEEAAFGRIAAEWAGFADGLGFATMAAIPLCARLGGNIVRREGAAPWYRGPTLLAHLEEVVPEQPSGPMRFPVQWVRRAEPDVRGYCGVVSGGRIAPGDAVMVAGTGRRSRVSRILGPGAEQAEALAGEAVTLYLADEVDLARGDVLAAPDDAPVVADQLAAHLLWLDAEAMLPGRQYLARFGQVWTEARVTAIRHRIDLPTSRPLPARRLEMNEMARCHLALARRVAIDPYAQNRATGAFLLVDRFSHRTVAAGMVEFALRRAGNIQPEALGVDKAARAALVGQKPLVVWFTGLSGAGKSTIARLVEQLLHRQGRHTYSLDGDNLRHGLNSDLGFTDEDRVENIRRVGEVARLFVDAGLIVMCSFISPFRAERLIVREMLGPGEFLEVFVDAPLAECMRRDPKGLYAKAARGEIANFTGISSPYQPPEAPELRLDTAALTPEAAAELVVQRVMAMMAEASSQNKV